MSNNRISARPRGLAVEKTAQIRALGSPTRQTIVDVISAIGPCSVPEIAEIMGVRPDTLYYHTRLLERVGLVFPVDSRQSVTRPEAILDVPARHMYVSYDLDNRENKAAVLQMVGSMLRTAMKRFRDGFRKNVAVTRGARRNLWAASIQSALSAHDLARVNAHLHALLTILERRRRDPAVLSRDEPMYALTFVLSPASRSEHPR